MADALALYHTLVSRGTSPALTWYGTDGRMELSGKVAANHMAKVAGYLADEIWLDEGSHLYLDLPAHWKTCLWGLGAMLAGINVSVAGQNEPPETPADAILTDRPELAGEAESVLALDLGPLALRWMGAPLPAGVFDASAEVMSSPDQLMDTSRADASNFPQWEAAGQLVPEGPRLLLAGGSAKSSALTLAAVGWQMGRGSVVVVNDGDPTHIAEAEGATRAQLRASATS